jgi:DNA-binding GntR family transcriptional regulator
MFSGSARDGQRGRVEPLEQGSLSARSYLALRSALTEGKFRPGERLVMRELAEMLGTSVTPIREGCLRLVSEQALELRAGRFITVPDLTLSRYMEIRTIRMALEGLAAEIAASKIPLDALPGLRLLHNKYVKAEKNRQSAIAMTSNREFHFAISTAAGLGMLSTQIESLWVSMGPILAVYYSDMPLKHVGGEEHVNLLDAFQKRDGKMARSAIERDILLGGENIIQYLTRPETGSHLRGTRVQRPVGKSMRIRGRRN